MLELLDLGSNDNNLLLQFLADVLFGDLHVLGGLNLRGDSLELSLGNFECLGILA